MNRNYQNSAGLMGATRQFVSSSSAQQCAQDQCATEGVRSPHVAEEVGLLQGAAGSLEEVVDSLISRLGAVLSPMPTSPNGEAALDTYRVPLAESIRTQRRQVQANVERLQDLLRALEL